MTELWAQEFHRRAALHRIGGGADVVPAVEAWLAACWEHREAIGVWVWAAPGKRAVTLLEVQAVRFRDEAGEICVVLADEAGQALVEPPPGGSLDPSPVFARRWVRSPVPIPVEVMRLALADL